MKKGIIRLVMFGFALVFAVVNLLITTAYTQETQKGSELFLRILRAWDTNGDGRLGPSEWKGKRPFGEVDINGDGVITEDDFTFTQADVSPVNRFERLVSVWDMDKDGKISPDEWKSKKDFRVFDKNEDGFITREDFSRGTAEAGTIDPQSQQGHPLVDVLDLNRDGRISRAEWNKEKGNFDDFDKNIDGYVTHDEL